MTTPARDYAAEWHARRIAHYYEQLARGEHDADCEQRERSSICHCAKRKRTASGFTEPPYLHVSSPVCGECGNQVNFDGDAFICEYCNVTWSEPETRGEFTDDYGTNFGGEQFGARLIEGV